MLAVFSLLIEIGLLVAVKSSGITDVGDVIASILIIVESIIVISVIYKSHDLNKYGNAILFGYLLRITLLYFDLYGNNIFILPNSGADAEMFYNGAIRFSLYGGSTRTNFPLIMGSLFRYLGTNRLYAQFLILLCSVVSLCICAKSLNRLNLTDNTRNKIQWVVCLLPSFAILSSIFLRESIICMFVSLSVYEFVLWINTKKERNFILCLLLVLPASWLHSGTIGMIAGYAIVRFLYDNETRQIHLRAWNIIVAIIIGVGIAYGITNYGNVFFAKFLGVDSLDDIANTDNSAGSSYAAYVGNSNNPVNFIFFTPLRIIFFLFSPFPWQWRGLSDIIAFLFSGMFYFVSVALSIRSLYSGNNKNRVLINILMIVALSTTFIFAWGVSNSGTAARHRDKLVIIYALLWALSSDYGKAETEIESRKALKYIKS